MTSDSTRLHAFDNLRAIIALLGIPFHVAAFLWLLQNNILESNDFLTRLADLFTISDANSLLYLVVFYLHVFRMPAFFLLAGFFSHMMYQKRKWVGFIKNRALRILLPFILVIILMIPSNLSPLMLLALKAHHTFFTVIKQQYTAHHLWQYLDYTGSYWFLYDLLWFYVIALLLVMCNQSGSVENNVLHYLAKKFSMLLSGYRLYCVVLCLSAGSLMLCGWWYPKTNEQTFLPNFPFLFFYCIWYFLGWNLWSNRYRLSYYANAPWIKAIASIVSALLYLMIFKYFTQIRFIYPLCVFLYCFSMMMGVFALLGLVHRYFSWHSPIMRYFVRASYWIYLVQIPILSITMPLIAISPLPFITQFLLGIVGCLALSLLTFQWIVRPTWLNKILG